MSRTFLQRLAAFIQLIADPFGQQLVADGGEFVALVFVELGRSCPDVDGFRYFSAKPVVFSRYYSYVAINEIIPGGCTMFVHSGDRVGGHLMFFGVL